jgi:hypothetical protein
LNFGRGSIDKAYFLSDLYPYHLMFLVDSGPQYGRDMEWPTAPVSSLADDTRRVAIIDNRIAPTEIAALAALIPRQPDRLFVFTIVDPFTKQNEDGPYREFLLSLAASPNVLFLSKYHPCEFSDTLRRAVGGDRFVVVHYPYVVSRERPHVDHRSKRMIFAGAIDAAVYPERYHLYEAIRSRPWLRMLIHHLEHPGYAEVGDPVVHQKVGDRFIEYLANYRFMFMSGSRCELEFLKYRECAYAGCVPVGAAPATFDAELRECILPLDPADPRRTLRKYRNLPAAELDQRAARFAELQRTTRSPAVLNDSLDAFLARHLAGR